MFRIIIKTTLFVVPVTVAFFDIIGKICRVDGFSMKPTINNSKKQNYIFLSRWKHYNFDYKRGEVICLVCPTNPKQNCLKRIIGLEGDVVKTQSYHLSHVKIPKGHCWVEGDNHKHSLDSNTFGPVPLALLQSRATHVVWPPSEFKRIEPTDTFDRLSNTARNFSGAEFYDSVDCQSSNANFKANTDVRTR